MEASSGSVSQRPATLAVKHAGLQQELTGSARLQTWQLTAHFFGSHRRGM